MELQPEPLSRDNEEDEEGLAVFVPSKLEQEHHLLPPSSSRGKRSKTLKYCVCTLIAMCGVVVLIAIIGMAVGAAIEITKLRSFDTTDITDLEWWKRAVIYQVYPRSYQDSDGDGSGDLAGIINRTEYLSEVGVDTIWLSPIFSSPQRDNGYDVSNYTDVDPLFGTLDQLKLLLKDLHEKSMHLLLDFVPNHTSNEHPWFIESRQDRENPKRDWYVWADGKGNGIPPNNWISVFGGPAWTYDNVTNQWYLHQFSEFQPDLNYSNPDVRKAFEDVLKFWLEFGVDGFRIDAVVHLLEDPSLRDEPLNPDHGNSCLANCYGYLIHNYTRNYPGIHDIIRGWRRVMDSYSQERKRFMVGEVYEDVNVVMLYYGQNNDEFHFPFNFFLLENSNWNGTQVNSIINSWLDNMPQGGWPNWVLGNHDNRRIASKAGIYLARTLQVLLMTLPGTPTSYYGDEILMTDVNVTESERQDLYGDRDKERTPMQWSNESNAGFTTGNPWLPLADNFTIVNVKVESKNTSSILTMYKSLVKLRYACQFLNINYIPVLATSDVLAYIRHCETESIRYLVIINFSNQPVDVSLNVTSEFSLSSTVHLSSNPNRSKLKLNLSESIMLLGGEGVILSGTYV